MCSVLQWQVQYGVTLQDWLLQGTLQWPMQWCYCRGHCREGLCVATSGTPAVFCSPAGGIRRTTAEGDNRQPCRPLTAATQSATNAAHTVWVWWPSWTVFSVLTTLLSSPGKPGKYQVVSGRCCCVLVTKIQGWWTSLQNWLSRHGNGLVFGTLHMTWKYWRSYLTFHNNSFHLDLY